MLNILFYLHVLFEYLYYFMKYLHPIIIICVILNIICFCSFCILFIYIVLDAFLNASLSVNRTVSGRGVCLTHHGLAQLVHLS